MIFTIHIALPKIAELNRDIFLCSGLANIFIIRDAYLFVARLF